MYGRFSTVRYSKAINSVPGGALHMYRYNLWYNICASDAIIHTRVRIIHDSDAT